MNSRRSVLLRIFCVLAVLLTVCSGLIFRQRLKAASQGGMATVTIYMYPNYQFNVLRGPTGIAAVDKQIGTGGASYRTEFHLYIADSANHVIRDFNSYTGTLSTLSGSLGSPGYVNGSLSSAQYKWPTGLSAKNNIVSTQNGCDGWYYPPFGHCCPVCTNPHIDRYNAQEIYVSDSQNFVMRRICAGDNQAATGNCVGQMGQVVTSCGSGAKGYSNGSSLSASFASLGGNSQKSGAGTYYYMADAENHAIRSWNGSWVYTVAGTGQPGFVDGPSSSAQFMAPGKVVEGGSGYLYVADIGNNAIRMIDSSGYVSTCAGGGPTAYGYVNGQGSQAKFNRPTAVVYNSADSSYYIADSHNNVIRKMDQYGNVTTYAGTGETGLVNGPISQAKFSMPIDLLIHNGYMYVSDNQNNVIRRIDMAAGTVITLIS